MAASWIPSRRSWMLGLALLVALGQTAQADDILPQPFPASRYAKMGAHSPFSPPTLAAPVRVAVAAPTVSWSDKLAVTSLMQQAGRYFATVLDRDTSEHFSVSSDKEPVNNRNMILASVQWAEPASQTRVTISRGTELGQVAFDPAAATASPERQIQRPMSPGQALFHPPASNVGMGGGGANIVRRPAIPAPIGPRIGERPAPVRPVNTDDDDDDDQ